MAIDFPSSPSVNDTFTVGDTTYKWDGTVWTSTVSGAVDFLPVTGGTVTGAITASGGVVGDVTGNVDGNLTGDVTGNVSGNLTGNVTGDVTGDVSGTAGTVSVTGSFGSSSKRPIACWGSAADGGGATQSGIRYPVDGPGTANIRGDGRIFATGLDTGDVVITSTMISSGMGASLVNMGNTSLGSILFAGKRDTGSAVDVGGSIAGSNLRVNNADGAHKGSGSLNGTWRCKGYAKNNNTNYSAGGTTCWIRIA